MRRIVLAAVILAVTASVADARRQHHHRFYVYKHAPVMLMAPRQYLLSQGDARLRRDGLAPFSPWNFLPPPRPGSTAWKAWVWLLRRHPLIAIAIAGFLSGLLSGRRR